MGATGGTYLASLIPISRELRSQLRNVKIGSHNLGWGTGEPISTALTQHTTATPQKSLKTGKGGE